MKALITLNIRITSQSRSGYGFLYQETNKMKHILSLMLLCILFSAASCKKEQPDPPPDLPPLTNVGAMTFGCYVNGKPWVAQVPPFQAEFIHLSASYSISNKRFVMSALKITQSSSLEQIAIVIENVEHDVSEYKNLLNYYPYKSFNYECKEGLPNNNFYLDTTSNNTIIFNKLDINNNIASGNFDFTVLAINCPDEKVELIGGRFDVKFSIIE